MQAIIKRSGKLKNKFRFVLRGKNGEVIAVSEQYEQKQSAVKTVKKYFPGFEILDQSIK